MFYGLNFTCQTQKLHGLLITLQAEGKSGEIHQVPKTEQKGEVKLKLKIDSGQILNMVIKYFCTNSQIIVLKRKMPADM